MAGFMPQGEGGVSAIRDTCLDVLEDLESGCAVVDVPMNGT